MTPGQKVIDGRFELLDRLGSGGMGTVWRARDLALHREVALKEVRPPGPTDDDPARARMMRDRILLEARALARLHHPNVVTIHHIVDTPETPHPWIVMELVPGRSLQDRIVKELLPPAEAAAIGRGILAALRAAHTAGILHRDVKPANVLLRADGSPVLTDFGIAALYDTPGLTATGELVGSPEYIAPERLRGQEGNPASDLWSLGMLLYVGVEGTHPMRRDTPLATLAAVLDGRIPPPVRSGALTPVLNALLHPDPAARPDPARLDAMLADAAMAPPTYAPPPGHASGPGYPTGPGQVPPPAYPPPQQPVYGRPTGPHVHGWVTQSTRRRRGAGPLVAGAVVLAALLVAGAILVPQWLDSDPGGDPGRTNTASSRSPSASAKVFADDDAPVTEAPVPDTSPLLTPKRIREVIAAMEEASGSKVFTDFSVHEQFASGKAPVRGKKSLYDSWDYRDGQVSKGSGGSLSSFDKPIQLSTLNWEALPSLFKTAEKRLGIDKPTSRYVIVEPAWPFSGAPKPAILVYLSDSYGGAYLAADAKGKILRLYKRD
ncbi:serine/threonine-protein kinase [Nonomuraea sp. NPDC050790]|uniref:serine/threonine-protein kinase n=1 Tax=Nonomuraea sp. NPDC050790 TaxID=3364371 RepID=UPI0037AA8B4D